MDVNEWSQLFFPNKPKEDKDGNMKERVITLFPFLAFDIEDDSAGNFLIACVYGDRKERHRIGKGKAKWQTKHYEETFTGKEGYDALCKLINTYSSREGKLIGFNVDYDLSLLEKNINISKLYAKGRFISATTKEGASVYDLSNHVQRGTSLEDIMPLVGMKKVKNESDEEEERLDIERREGKINEQWIMRCKSDAKATWMLTHKLQLFYKEHGTPFKLTIGSAALTIYREHFFKGFWGRKPSQQWINAKERLAYRGGNTQLFRKGIFHVESKDLNSAYVAAMRDYKYPNPMTAQHSARLSLKSLDTLMNDYQGIAKIKVHIPLMMYPPLPYKREIDGKMIYPYGDLVAWWTYEEIKLAEKMGCTINKVYETIYYTESLPYFKEYAEMVWDERQKHPKDSDNPSNPENFVNRQIKLLGNSLYGKWGQVNEVGAFYIPKKEMKAWLEDEGNYAIAVKQGYEEINNYYYISGGEQEESKHSFPILSAYITSYVRITLYKKIVETNAIYTDTDSVKYEFDADIPITDTKELGGWGYEGRWYFEGFAPKTYRISDNKREWKWKVKGIPQSVLKGKRGEFEINQDRIIAHYDKPNKYKESIRRNLVMCKWEETSKEQFFIDDKRDWKEDGSSLPLLVVSGEQEYE